MNNNSVVPLKDQKDKTSLLIEVTKVEKLLLALIHTKGLLHSDVQNLYRKICSSYEKIILNDHELAELQDVEYSLWKLHYRHIVEFRKTIMKSSGNDETTKFVMLQSVVAAQSGNDNYIEGLKSFLSEATKFYQNLIIKIKRYYGLPEDFSFYKSGSNSVSVEAKKMQKLQFLCHCFLVSLGDIARYREQCVKSNVQNHNWSVAVTHYVEATMIWPDGGNPQHKLAVLAMYVGDEFLALYHCIRSLAVKDPFPDARNNLIFLFERNRSSHLDSLSSEAQFDFLKPSESSAETKSQSTNDLSNGKMVKAEHESLRETNLWPLIIRMISFFFIKSSLEDFLCTFASTMKELDMLMALDDSKLYAAMEAYQCMDSSRNGPFRFLQVISVFIFVIENLVNSLEVKDSKNKNEEQQLVLTQLALTVTFIFMGRLVDRCSKATLLDSCPLLPALLVFVEWLASNLDEAETYGSDDKSTSAMSYFFGAFLELLRRFDTNRGEIEPSGGIALWEDYELRGFAPLAHLQISLDFSTYEKYADSFESGSDHRAHRIINASRKIADRPNNKQKWIIYDKSGRKFCIAESDKFPDRKESEKGESTSMAVEVKEPDQFVDKATKECEKLISEQKLSNPLLGKSVAMEEEEVILFKPLTRYNSAPLYGSIISNNEMPPKDTRDQIVPADECLRRATSLLLAQNQAHGDPSAFHSDLTNFRGNQPLKQQEPVVKDTESHLFSEASISPESPSFSSSISAGPPSLNAWVLNRGGLINDRVKGVSDAGKHSLAPIEEIASVSLNDFFISETEDSITSSQHAPVTTHYSSPVYLAPVPSAPFLPDDAVWFNGVQSIFSDCNSPGSINRTNNSFDALQVSGYSNWTGSQQPVDYGPGIPGFVDGYPQQRRMTSSEWLRQYRESHNLERGANNIWPVHSYATGTTGNFHGHDNSRSVLYDQWGTPVASNPLIYEESRSPPLHPIFPQVYGTDEHKREKLFHGYQRPTPYGCGVVNETEPLLQYLKEKEWLLQQDPTLRGPTYMGH